MVSDASLACMIVAAVISFGAPVVALVVARRRLHVQFRAVLVGVLVFVVFAGFLEQLVHALAFSAFPGLRSTERPPPCSWRAWPPPASRCSTAGPAG